MKLALAQMDIVWEDPATNLNTIKGLISDAKNKACDLIVFPEMATTGFSMDAGKVAEAKSGSSVVAITGFCVEYNINILIGLSLKEDGEKKGANTALFLDRSGEIKSDFTKLHPFSFAGEDKYYRSGEKAVLFKVDDVNASVFICYDLRFPEEFRSVANSVQVIFVIANWPASRIKHWTALLKARAIENQTFVVGVNRVGSDGNDLVYNGQSIIIGPDGEVIKAAGTTEELLVGEIDASSVAILRNRLPFLADMKNDRRTF